MRNHIWGMIILNVSFYKNNYKYLNNNKMKYKITKLFIVLTAIFTLNSCNKDDVPEKEDNSESYYKIYVEDNLIAESTDADINILNNDLYGGSKNNNDISFFISNLPEINETVNVSYQEYTDNLYNGGNGSGIPTLNIIGDVINTVNPFAQQIQMFTGTITRETKFKITFEGTYYDLIDSGQTLHNFHGEVISRTVINN